MDPEVVKPDASEVLAQMAALIPNYPPESSKVVGFQTFRGSDYSTSNLTLEYQLPNKWMLVNVQTRKRGDVTKLVGLNVNMLPDSLEHMSRFTLAGKSANQYLILLCAISSILFSVYVFVVCARTKNVTAKWLRQVSIFVGIVRFGVNWTTAEASLQPISISFPPAMATRPFFGPWTIAVYIPIGAILFMQHRFSMKMKGELQPTPRSVSSSPPDLLRIPPEMR